MGTFCRPWLEVSFAHASSVPRARSAAQPASTRMERRIDPVDWVAYTKLEFADYYGVWYHLDAVESYWHGCAPIPLVSMRRLAVHNATLEYIVVEASGDNLALRSALVELVLACIEALPASDRVPPNRNRNTPPALFEAVAAALGRTMTPNLKSNIGKAYRHDYAPDGKTNNRRRRRRDRVRDPDLYSTVRVLSSTGEVRSIHAYMPPRRGKERSYTQMQGDIQFP